MAKYKNRAAAPAHLLTKTELKQQRTRLAFGQYAVAQYWQGHGYVALYDPASAVPMRPRKEPTPAQLATLAAGRALVGTSPCSCCGKRFNNLVFDRDGRCYPCALQADRDEQEKEFRAVCRCAAEWLQYAPLFLDTETTGLDADAEIIEIAILDAAGVVLLETLVRPCGPIPAAATAVNGITDQDVAHAPSWPEVGQRVVGILTDKLAIAHNTDFDKRMLHQSYMRNGVALPAFSLDCTMTLLTELNGGRWPNLGAAARLAGVSVPGGQRHRARYDAELCRQIVLALGTNR